MVVKREPSGVMRKEIGIMKRGIFLLSIVGFAALGLLGACATQDSEVQVATVFSQPCTIYEEIGATPENSLICAKIENPCAAQSILATAAKAPALWKKKEYCELFDEWAGKVQAILESGVTYRDLQDLVLMQIAKLNDKAGLALLVVSDGIFVFSEESPIRPIDRQLILMSLVDLRAQVARLAILV